MKQTAEQSLAELLRNITSFSTPVHFKDSSNAKTLHCADTKSLGKCKQLHSGLDQILVGESHVLWIQACGLAGITLRRTHVFTEFTAVVSVD